MPDIVITCEHASPRIPEQLTDVMSVPADIESHRLYDAGAIEAATAFAFAKKLTVHSFPVSRLLVDANRSITNPEIFSEYAMKLTEADRLNALREYYLPFRIKVLKEMYAKSRIIHLSFHTFTPVLNGAKRDCEVGILFDNARPLEADIARGLVKHLQKNLNMRIAENKPYDGTDDGHTTALRCEFINGRYSGIEIEMSQSLSTAEMVHISNIITQYF